MVHSPRPTSSFTYFGNQSGQVFDQAASQFQNAFDRIRNAIHILGNCYAAASYGLRQEVPFERWFFDHGFQKPIDDPSHLIKAHSWAIMTALEGLVRVSAESVSYVYSKIFAPEECERHLDVLKAQWQGLNLSLLAVVSPNAAKTKADNHGKPLIGCSIFQWRWGTLYTGKMEVPLWHVECRQYPWAHRPT